MDILTAVERNDPNLVMTLLQQGAPHTPDDCDYSPLHIALMNYGLMQRHIAENGTTRLAAPTAVLFNLSQGSADITSTVVVGERNAQEESQKAEFIAQLLLMHGARLDVAPQNSRDPCPPSDDAGLWLDAAFGARIMVTALYAAAKHREPLPRMRILQAVQQQLGVTETTDKAQLGRELHSVTQNMEAVRAQTGLALLNAEIPTAAWLRSTLSLPEKAYWARSFLVWDRLVAKPMVAKAAVKHRQVWAPSAP